MSELEANITSILCSLIDTSNVTDNTNATEENSNLNFEHLNDSSATENKVSPSNNDNEATNGQESVAASLVDDNTPKQSKNTAEDTASGVVVEKVLDLAEADATESNQQIMPQPIVSNESEETNSSIVAEEASLEKSDQLSEVTAEKSSENTAANESGACAIDQSVQSSMNYEVPAIDSSNLQPVQDTTENGKNNETENVSEAPQLENSDGEQEDDDEYVGVECDVVASGGDEDAEFGETIISEEIIADEPVSKLVPSNSENKARQRKRRRILIYNDESSDSDLEQEREKILQSRSPTPEAVPITTTTTMATTHQSDYSENDSDSITEIPDESDDDIVDRNERPGPKSKKQSTRLLKELKAKALLQSAIVIPIQAKKKKRVIDSDDDDDNNDDDEDDINTALGLNDNTCLDDIGAVCDENADIADVNTESPDIVVDPVPVTSENRELDGKNHVNKDTESRQKSFEGKKDHAPIRIKKESELICQRERKPIVAGVSFQIPIESNIIVKSEPGDMKESAHHLQPQSPINLNLVTIKGEPIPGKNNIVKTEPNTTVRVKTEQHYSRNFSNSANTSHQQNRLQHQKKIDFNRSLNEPIFDSSSDEDYFLPNDVYFGRKQSNQNNRWLNTSASSMASMQSTKKKKRHIPNDIYFNAKVPLHILHSYDDSSSSESEKGSVRPTPRPSIFPPKQFVRTPNWPLANKMPFNKMPLTRMPIQQTSNWTPNRMPPNRMPPVHKIMHNRIPFTRPTPQPTRPQAARPQATRPHIVLPPARKPTVFDQLDKMKQYLSASGIKVKVNELLKGSKTYQERCDRILDILHRNGIEGEPTMAKCKQLRKQLRIKKEIEGLDTTLIIPTEGEGRTRRATRMATRRNYVYDDLDEPQRKHESLAERKEDATELLKKIKEFIDSDSSDYEAEEHSKTESEKSTEPMENVIESIEKAAQPIDEMSESMESIKAAVEQIDQMLEPTIPTGAATEHIDQEAESMESIKAAVEQIDQVLEPTTPTEAATEQTDQEAESMESIKAAVKQIDQVLESITPKESAAKRIDQVTESMEPIEAAMQQIEEAQA